MYLHTENEFHRSMFSKARVIIGQTHRQTDATESITSRIRGRQQQQ